MCSINATPKNAWKERVARKAMNRIGYAGRAGPGSTPMNTQKNR